MSGRPPMSSAGHQESVLNPPLRLGVSVTANRDCCFLVPAHQRHLKSFSFFPFQGTSFVAAQQKGFPGPTLI